MFVGQRSNMRSTKIRAEQSRVLVSVGILLSALGSAKASPVLTRFPTTSAREIAFVARNGLWVAPLVGGGARRIVGGPSEVIAPRFSPDGRFLAYTAHVGEARDIYVVASDGGGARRLTFDGAHGHDLVLGWTPDGKRIVYLSGQGAPNGGLDRAFSVPAAGGAPEALPLDRAGLMSFSSDGREIIYNRIFRNFELRKRYLGGQHQNLWRYEFASKTLTRLTDWKGTDTNPMWVERKVFFLSDRGSDFRKNIWVMDLDTRAIRQITRFADYDVDWPSLGAGGIAFQQGGKLYHLDPSSEKLDEIKVEVPDDRAQSAPGEGDASGFVRVKDALGGVDYGLSPDGSALFVSAHGDLVSVAIHGASVDLTRSPGVDEDHPSVSPDGRTLAYTTDVDGEQQVAVRPVAGGPERLLTHSRAGYFYSACWSPKGDVLAVADANHALWLVPLDGRGPTLISRDPYAEIRDASFSPDGRWLAYSTQRSTRLRAIHLREIKSGHDTVVSSPMESDRLPVFTSDGRYLAFVSQRHEQPFVSDRDDESLISTINSDGFYISPLSQLDAAPKVGGPPPTGAARIDLDGLMARAVALPVTPTVIASLEVRGDQLFYETKAPQLIGGDLAGQVGALRTIDLVTLKDREVIKGLSTHALSADGVAVAFRRDGEWRLASTRPETNAGAGSDVALDLSNVRVPMDPRRDWTDMLQDAWRLDRDVFFSPAMNGTDWGAVRTAYARLWPLVGSEQDFLYLLGEMQGEIASSHTFIDPSPAVGPKAPPATPLLGADYALDPASGRYRFARIYLGDQSREALRGPLGAPGLNVNEGDYLLAVDGRELRAPAAPLSLFSGLKGPLKLTVASTPLGRRRTIIVDPVDGDVPIRHLAWVEANRRTVDRLSGGRLGYVALSDFDDEGSQEFVRQFYPQLDKQGLIFDVRWNHGGFTSQAVLDVLRRLREGEFVNREGALSPLPTAAPPPAMAVLENYHSSSDGDQFPFYFRKYSLGPVVGERTWGGVQGINGAWKLMDGTGVYIPKDSLAERDGGWVIENVGTPPDIAVDTSPADPPGMDRQLQAAVHAGLEQLRAHPDIPARAPAWLPAYPTAGEVPGTSEGPLPAAHNSPAGA